MRNRLREGRFRSGYVEDKYQVYVDLVRLLLQLGRVEEAFSSAERLRARSYLDLLDGGTAAVRSEAWRREEKALRARIRQLQRALEEEAVRGGSGRRQRAAEVFSSELQDAERAYQQLLDDLLSMDPAAAAVQSLRIPDPDRLRALLEPGGGAARVRRRRAEPVHLRRPAAVAPGGHGSVEPDRSRGQGRAPEGPGGEGRR